METLDGSMGKVKRHRVADGDGDTALAHALFGDVVKLLLGRLHHHVFSLDDDVAAWRRQVAAGLGKGFTGADGDVAADLPSVACVAAVNEAP